MSKFLALVCRFKVFGRQDAMCKKLVFFNFKKCFLAQRACLADTISAHLIYFSKSAVFIVQSEQDGNFNRKIGPQPIEFWRALERIVDSSATHGDGEAIALKYIASVSRFWYLLSTFSHFFLGPRRLAHQRPCHQLLPSLLATITPPRSLSHRVYNTDCCGSQETRKHDEGVFVLTYPHSSLGCGFQKRYNDFASLNNTMRAYVASEFVSPSFVATRHH